MFRASPKELLSRKGWGLGKGWAYRPGAAGYPLLLAHVDTVRRSPATITISENTITAVDGGILGADDRAGVSLLLHAEHAGYPGSLLLTDGEESGGWGMESFLKAGLPKTLPWSFLWAFDYRGSLAFTSYSPQESAFVRWFSDRIGAVESSGIWSDVALLAESTGLAHVNFAIGYHGAHCPGERLSLPAWNAAYKALMGRDWKCETWKASKVRLVAKKSDSLDWYRGWNRVETGYCVLCGRRTSADELCDDCGRQINGLNETEGKYVS